jgi:hypothetical protein
MCLCHEWWMWECLKQTDLYPSVGVAAIVWKISLCYSLSIQASLWQHDLDIALVLCVCAHGPVCIYYSDYLLFSIFIRLFVYPPRDASIFYSPFVWLVCFAIIWCYYLLTAPSVGRWHVGVFWWSKFRSIYNYRRSWHGMDLDVT